MGELVSGKVPALPEHRPYGGKWHQTYERIPLRIFLHFGVPRVTFCAKSGLSGNEPLFDRSSSLGHGTDRNQLNVRGHCLCISYTAVLGKIARHPIPSF